MSEYPAVNSFPTRERDDIIKRYNTHMQCMIDAEGMAKNTMLKNFTAMMKWINWKVTLINFLKSQPGSNGVPLNYAAHDNVKPIVRNNPNFLNDYSDKTQLQGEVFTHNAAKVHSYIIGLISDNIVAG